MRGPLFASLSLSLALSGCSSFRDPQPPAGINAIPFIPRSKVTPLERRAEADDKSVAALIQASDQRCIVGHSCVCPADGTEREQLWNEAIRTTNQIRLMLPVTDKKRSLSQLETDLASFRENCN